VLFVSLHYTFAYVGFITQERVYIYIYTHTYILRVILFSIFCNILVLLNIQNLKVSHNGKIYRARKFITQFTADYPWTLQSIS